MGPEPPRVGVMDLRVKRSAFGRQVDSFEVDLTMKGYTRLAQTPFHALFIRSALVASAGACVDAYRVAFRSSS